MQNYFKAGSHNVVCDVCGFRFKVEDTRKRWDGLIVCAEDFEKDHPQKYLRIRETGLAVDPIRAEPTDDFLHICYLYALSAYADLAEADCAQADNITFPYLFLYNLKNSGAS